MDSNILLTVQCTGRGNPLCRPLFHRCQMQVQWLLASSAVSTTPSSSKCSKHIVSSDGASGCLCNLPHLLIYTPNQHMHYFRRLSWQGVGTFTTGKPANYKTRQTATMENLTKHWLSLLHCFRRLKLCKSNLTRVLVSPSPTTPVIYSYSCPQAACLLILGRPSWQRDGWVDVYMNKPREFIAAKMPGVNQSYLCVVLQWRAYGAKLDLSTEPIAWVGMPQQQDFKAPFASHLPKFGVCFASRCFEQILWIPVVPGPIQHKLKPERQMKKHGVKHSYLQHCLKLRSII